MHTKHGTSSKIYTISNNRYTWFYNLHYQIICEYSLNMNVTIKTYNCNNHENHYKKGYVRKSKKKGDLEYSSILEYELYFFKANSI